MQRILVMGSSGSGKSTFAQRLSAATGIPFVSLDALFWKPGWVESEPAEFDARVTEAARQPRWIMDGDFFSYETAKLRRQLADTIFWFDLPRLTCMLGIVTRLATGHGRIRPEMAEGCPEKFDPAFLHYVWTYRTRRRPKLLEYLEGLRPDQSPIRFTARAQSDRYLADIAPAAIPARAQ
jgi:adenylate kinase family enzyme